MPPRAPVRLRRSAITATETPGQPELFNLQKRRRPSVKRERSSAFNSSTASVASCPQCISCYTASSAVVVAYKELLLNAKLLFLDDMLHHFSGEDLWIRVWRALQRSNKTAAAPHEVVGV